MERQIGRKKALDLFSAVIQRLMLRNLFANDFSRAFSR